MPRRFRRLLAVQPEFFTRERERYGLPEATIESPMLLQLARDAHDFPAWADRSVRLTPLDFWAVWLGHRDFLLGLCSRHMKGRQADAEDALARAQQKALAGLPSVMRKADAPVRSSAQSPEPCGQECPPYNLKGWLSCVTTNVCRDIHRENQRRGWSLNGPDDPLAQQDETFVSPDADASESLLLRELEEVLRKAIGELPERLRETAALFLLEESSYGEISQKLGISGANARKRIQESRALLQETVAPYLCGASGS